MMSDPKWEQVVLVRDSYLSPRVTSAGFHPMRSKEIFRALAIAGINASFHADASAGDRRIPLFRQLVSYIVVVSGDDLLRYNRPLKAAHESLEGLVSIGLGGHLDIVDYPSQHPPPALPEGGPSEEHVEWVRWLVETGARRELREELGVRSMQHPIRWKGFVVDNGDLTASGVTYTVGQQHLGIVGVLLVGDAQLIRYPNTTLQNLTWDTWDRLEFVKDRLEPWSRLLWDARQELT